MYVRKCSRCEEKTSTLYGGKKCGEEFWCEECLKKAIESGEIEPPPPSDGEPKYFVITVLKGANILYFIVSIFVQMSMLAQLSSISQSFPHEMNMNVNMNGILGEASILAIIQAILIFFVISVFILLVETVLKIYHKMK